MSKLIKKNNHIHSDTLKYIKQYAKGIEQISFHQEYFGGKEVRILLEAINWILLKKRSNKVIYIWFEQFMPRDKLSYIILESIIQEVIEIYNKGVIIHLGKVVTGIHTQGLENSLLVQFAYKKFDFLQYSKEYQKKNHTEINSFRRIVDYEKGNSVSELMSDVKSFLRCFDFDKKDINKIAHLVSELADNACEHGKSNCIIDIDISEPHYKGNDKKKEYYAINICVLNFSCIILGDALERKLCSGQLPLKSRYVQIINAYECHKKYFDKKYSKEHFFSLASMQNNITGRENEFETGGKGLTELVKELELNSTDYDCYVLFGNNIISFEPEFLDNDSNNFISFNKQKDFLHLKPDKRILGFSDTYLDGTGYNLTLVYKKGEENGK